MFGGRNDIEKRQILDFEFIVTDLDQGNIQFRLDGDHLAVIVGAVSQVNRDPGC